MLFSFGQRRYDSGTLFGVGTSSLVKLFGLDSQKELSLLSPAASERLWKCLKNSLTSVVSQSLWCLTLV